MRNTTTRWMPIVAFEMAPVFALMLPELCLQEKSKEPIKDAVRSDSNKKAYDDFLKALESVQQRTPLEGHFTGAHISKELADQAEWYIPEISSFQITTKFFFFFCVNHLKSE
jgi:hypothetical protein